MKKIVTFILAFMASVGTIFAASGTCGDNLTWDLTDGVLTISGTGPMTGWSSAFNVPWKSQSSSIYTVLISDGVTSIGQIAFSGCNQLTSITIPNSVTSIGNSALYNCSKLTSITIPNSVTSIGRYAFSGCSGLNSVTIPNSVTSIGDGTFSECNSMTSIIVDKGNSIYDSRNNCNAIIETATNTLVAGCKNTTIPDGVTSIGDYAFSECIGLISVTIPNSVTSIGERAFSECIGLTSVTIPNSVTSIGDYAFTGCSSLTSITIPNGVTSIGDGAFNGCTSLAHVTIPNTVTSIGYYAFKHCLMLISVTIPNSVTSIGAEAFSGCKGLISVTIPKSVTSIGNYAFAQCYKLNSIEVENGNTIYDSRNNCNAIIETATNTLIAGCKNTTISNSVTSIGDAAFKDCSDLTSIKIPNSVISIGEWAFSGCIGLTSVTCEAVIPPTLSSSAFYTEVVDRTKYIPLYVPAESVSAYKAANQWKEFTNIIAIGTDYKKVKIGNLYYNLYNYNAPNPTAEVTYDGYNHWLNYEYPPLATANIPSSVTYDDVTYTVTSIGEQAFNHCTNLTSVTIPNSVTSIGSGAFSMCEVLTSVTIPNSITSIGEGAFSSCKGLDSITCEAVNPPTLGNLVFNNVKKEIPLYVPAKSISAYQAADQWKDFKNIHGIHCVIASGKCGENLMWELHCDKELTINGTGLMTNYSMLFDSSPWEPERSSIKTISIDNNVTSIGAYAFSGCTGLTSIEIPNSVTSIGDGAFNGCSSLTSIEIPNSVTNIGTMAFNGCTGLTSIEIPNSVTSIGYSAFNGCTSLTSIEIPNSVKSIGAYAFSGCSSLTSVTIPNSVTSIESQVFSNCSELSFIEVENGNTIYDSRNNCNAIIETTTNTLIAGCKNTTIPNTVTCIGDYAFAECSSLSSVTIPSSVTSIGNSTFSNCSGLTSVTIPNSVTSIGNKAFIGCKILTSIAISNSVSSIGDYTFAGCSGLTSITCEAANPPTLGKFVFNNVKKEIPLYVPAESISAYQAANQWKDFKSIQAFTPTIVPTIYNNPSNSVQKLIRNGNMYLLIGDKIYTITGQEVK